MRFRTTISYLFLTTGLMLFAGAAMSQAPKNNYTAQWEKVETFIKKGLPASAMAEVDAIYKDAKQHNNEPQVIKSLLYKSHLLSGITEDATKKMIDTMEAEIQSSSGAVKSILQSVTAQLYRQYLSYNRYRLYSVSNTEGFKKEDIATWSLDDFKRKITGLFDESLAYDASTKISLEPYDAIIQKGNVRYLRPTLFDLLAHAALDYFKSSEYDVNRPAYAFEISDPAAFAPAKDFVNLSFESRDTLSLQLKALKVFQALIRLHLTDVRPLIDVDIERLQFVNQYGVMPQKQQLYIDALKEIYEQNKDASAADAGFLWGEEVRNQTASHKQAQSDNLARAVRIFERIMKEHPGSAGAIAASNELNRIRHPQLSITTEKVNLRNTPFRTLVQFANLAGIQLRVVPVTKKQKDYIQNADSQEKQFSRMLALKPVKEWKQTLPAVGDHTERTVEIKIDALPAGEYIILASENFSADKRIVSANFVFISDISYVNNGKNFFVLHRKTGRPIAGAGVNMLRRTYDYKTRTYGYTQVAHVRSDKDGFFRIPSNISDDLYRMQFDITTNDDRLFLDDEQRVYTYNPYLRNQVYQTQKQLDKARASIYFFTDRSLYRPGQTVYYKGIGITEGLKGRQSQLLQTTDTVRILLYNANGEIIDSLPATLNEYGSFHGSFTLPQNQLSGGFRISSREFPRQSVHFSVEEYKRPKFFAEFEKARASYRVNDSVRIRGKAEAYASNRVDGARVSYTVTRVARFIYPWRFWRIGFPRVAPMQIVHGETTTDEQGAFFIDFKAIPDLTIDPATDPVFDYQITAHITDINGETRTANIVVPVGYKALDLQLNIIDKKTYLSTNWKSFVISAKNLSGVPQDVVADLKVYRLKTPPRLLRERFWPAPDTVVMSEQEYIRYFPHDVYRDEDRPETWERTTSVLHLTDSVAGEKSVVWDKPLLTGWYVAEVTSRDPYGNEVKDLKYFRVLQPDDKKPGFPEYLVHAFDAKSYEPGDKASVYLATPADVYLLQQKDTMTVQDADTVSKMEFYAMRDEVRSFPFQITERDRGGFGVVSFFVKENRLYYTKDIVDVPWTNKQLDISLTTWRDKTLPGSTENWTLTVAGKKGEKIAAEMVANMYDASLDQFRPHSWNPMSLWPVYGNFTRWQADQNFSAIGSLDLSYSPQYKSVPGKTYDQFIMMYPAMFGVLESVVVRGVSGAAPAKALRQQAMMKEEGVSDSAVMPPPDAAYNEEVLTDGKPEEPQVNEQPVRKNFNETAFFLPELRTDKDGNISFSFKMPEALTTWKFMARAHTKDLSTGYLEKSVITQKDLMILPNAPRFLREGDTIEFSAKVVNMTDRELIARTEFSLLNAATLLPVDSWFENSESPKDVVVPAGQSRPVVFRIAVPRGFNEMVLYRITASTPEMSDGEEAFIPVVTNRMLVTESLPLEMPGAGTKNFSFRKLLESEKSGTLTHHGLTIEYTPNPAWYAVQALPWLNAYPYDGTEQVFNRYFANALAMNIANSSPKLKAVFEKWKHQDTSALMSNLQKNQELKSVLLEETPWVMQARNEEQQKKNIALLFDVVNMSNQLDAALKTVRDRQSSNGGFVWFKGGPDDRFMTQYIVADMGHLKNLGAWPEGNRTDLERMVRRALPYLDSRMNEDYEKLKKSKAKMEDQHLSYLIAHYLYARSFFKDIPVSAHVKEAYDYYIGQAKKYWLKQSVYSQGLLALALHRAGDSKVAADIVRSLRERAIVSETLGMYWKAWDVRGWWWYQAPIESQALMIEVFTEVAGDEKAVSGMKTWLLKNKQTNNWRTSKATAEAVYALLLQGADWLSQDQHVRIEVGDVLFDSKSETQQEGTGYFKRMIDGARVQPEMGKVRVTVQSSAREKENVSPSWGALYWQYFEDLDKITFAETPLKLSKKLFTEHNTDRGVVLKPVNDGDKLAVGDRIKVRIELRVDRDMEYVHMKDMRASSMEPVNVLSQYKWQGGLGYYETTKDVSTNFFFSYLPKGTYVFEYPMFVTHSGNFSNGITTIQSMYAPEFTAHSEGVRVEVKGQH